MTSLNKGFVKIWAKHFGSFLLWVAGAAIFGSLITQLPGWTLPYLVVAITICFGAWFSYLFAKSDYDYNMRKSEKVMNVLAKDNSN